MCLVNVSHEQPREEAAMQMEEKQRCGMEDGGRPSGERIRGNGRCEAPKFLGLDFGLADWLSRSAGYYPGPAGRGTRR